MQRSVTFTKGGVNQPKAYFSGAWQTHLQLESPFHVTLNLEFTELAGYRFGHDFSSF